MSDQAAIAWVHAWDMLIIIRHISTKYGIVILPLVEVTNCIFEVSYLYGYIQADKVLRINRIECRYC